MMDNQSIGTITDMTVEREAPTIDTLRSLPLKTRKIWSLRPTVVIQNNLLVRKDEDLKQLVEPTSLRERLFSHVHGGPLAAHLGSQRTLAQPKKTVLLTIMRKDVENWYKQYHACAMSKAPPNRPRGKLTKVITGAPMDIVAIDILSGLPVTKEGHKYLLVATDYYTKWTEAYPLKDGEASTCMESLYNYFFARMGLARQLHSVRGPNFQSKLIAELCELTAVNKSRTTVSPEVRRSNRTGKSHDFSKALSIHL